MCGAQAVAPRPLPADRVRCEQGNRQSPASKEQELVENSVSGGITSVWATQVSNLADTWAI